MEPKYVWEITIPIKIERKLWQAMVLIGIDISDECTVWFSDYIRMNKADLNGLYADVILTATDSEIIDLYRKLKELNVYATDMWIIDICDDEEDDIYE